MLGWRLLVSALLIPAVIGLFAWDAFLGPTAPVLFVMCLGLGLRCAWELLRLLKPVAADARYGPIVCGIALSLGATWGPHWLAAAGAESSLVDSVPRLEHMFAVSVLLVLIVRTVRFRRPGGHLAALGAEVLTTTYAGLLLAVTAQLRWLGPAGNGYLALGSLIAATKMGDVGAYSLGRMFGRRKMAPYVSPGKTWMGAVGAVLGGLLGGVLWLRLAAPWFDLTWRAEWWVYAAVYGAVLGVAGMLGDLCESLLKRDAGVKDSAALMPGFGGLLDLLDSILFAGPVAVLLWQLFLGTCTS